MWIEKRLLLWWFFLFRGQYCWWLFDFFFELQVFYVVVVVVYQFECFDVDVDVLFDELVGDLFVVGFGFYFFGDYWLVGYQQQCVVGNFVGEVGGEDGGGFYVYCYVVGVVQVIFECFVVFLYVVVGGVYCVGLVVVVEVVDYCGYVVLQLECW